MKKTNNKISITLYYRYYITEVPPYTAKQIITQTHMK